MTQPSPDPAPSPPPGPARFTPPPAESLSQSAVRRNLALAAVLSGVGCLLVMLVGVGLALLLAAS
jgi:hypothetical protein